MSLFFRDRSQTARRRESPPRSPHKTPAWRFDLFGPEPRAVPMAARSTSPRRRQRPLGYTHSTPRQPMFRVS